MKPLRHMPIAIRLSAYFIVLALLMLASMLYSLHTSQVLAGDAAAINQSGSLRMQAYRIANALNHAASQQHLGDLTETMDKTLASKDLVDAIPGDPDHAAHRHYQSILRRWTDMKAELRSGPEPYRSQVDSFVGEINSLVSALETRSELKIDNLRWLQTGAFLAALTLLMAFSWLILWRIVRPLARLTDTAEAVANGQLAQRTDYRSNDELGLMSSAFDRMANQLVNTNTELENRVAKQTQALKQKKDSLEFLFETSRTLSQSQRPLPTLMQELTSRLGTVAALNNVQWTDIAEAAPNPKSYRTKLDDMDTWLMIDAETPLEDWQRQLADTVCELVQSARDRAEQQENERHLALLQERSVLARELHDSIAQALSYQKLQVARWRKLQEIDADPEQIRTLVADVEQGLNAAYRNLRQLLATYRLKNDRPGIKAGIESTLDEYRKLTSTRFHWSMGSGWPTLTTSQEEHCLHIVRECLTNVIKHAHAKEAWVRLSHDNNRCQIDILDNGTGFPEQPEKQGHFGLAILKERAARIDGRITFNRRPEGGAWVCLRFPALSVVDIKTREKAP